VVILTDSSEPHGLGRKDSTFAFGLFGSMYPNWLLYIAALAFKLNCFSYLPLIHVVDTLGLHLGTIFHDTYTRDPIKTHQ